MYVYENARIRIPETEADSKTLMMYCDTVTDRLMLRLGVTELPESFERIAADAAVKMHRRCYYEGISSESMQGAAQLTTQFVEDILSEYQAEIDQYKASQIGTVIFL